MVDLPTEYAAPGGRRCSGHEWIVAYPFQKKFLLRQSLLKSRFSGVQNEAAKNAKLFQTNFSPVDELKNGVTLIAMPVLFQPDRLGKNRFWPKEQEQRFRELFGMGGFFNAFRGGLLRSAGLIPQAEVLRNFIGLSILLANPRFCLEMGWSGESPLSVAFHICAVFFQMAAAVIFFLHPSGFFFCNSLIFLHSYRFMDSADFVCDRSSEMAPQSLLMPDHQ